MFEFPLIEKITSEFMFYVFSSLSFRFSAFFPSSNGLKARKSSVQHVAKESKSRKESDVSASRGGGHRRFAEDTLNK